MRIMLLGAPGSGKGTQAQFIQKRYQIPQISTGDMLRKAIQADSPLGREAKAYVESGQLVPDPLMIALVKERIVRSDCQNGYLLDGFPRTLPQAEAMREAGIQLDHVIAIQVDQAELIKRITGRRIHVPSGRVYHIHYQPPKQPGMDDDTGEPLTQRDDDKEETVRKRLAVYDEQTAQLLAYYKDYAEQDPQSLKFSEVDGVGNPESIRDKIFQLLEPEEK